MKTAAWDFVSAHAEMFGVKRICRVLEVSRSGYYRWIAGAGARVERQGAEDALVEEIREIHAEHRGNHQCRVVKRFRVRARGADLRLRRVVEAMPPRRRPVHTCPWRFCGACRPSPTSRAASIGF